MEEAMKQAFEYAFYDTFQRTLRRALQQAFKGAMKGIFDFRLMVVDWRTAEADFSIKTQRHEEASDSPHV